MAAAVEEIEEIDEDALEVEEVEKVFDPSGKYSSWELEEWADQLLKADSNRELCRKCKEKEGVDSLPYGKETGEIESVAQYDEATGEPIVDAEGQQLYMDFPEMQCEKGHRWYKGEGARRDIKGKNPILLASHLYGRMRREIYVESGTPDPAFNRNRFDRPEHLMYNRSHPSGRKINTPDQRQANGASYYRAFGPLPLLLLHNGSVMLSILSIGILWLTSLLTKKQKTQLTCESGILDQAIARRSE